MENQYDNNISYTPLTRGEVDFIKRGGTNKKTHTPALLFFTFAVFVLIGVFFISGYTLIAKRQNQQKDFFIAFAPQKKATIEAPSSSSKELRLNPPDEPSPIRPNVPTSIPMQRQEIENQESPWIKIEGSGEESKINEIYTITIKGFSAGKEIRGFDIVMPYNKNIAEIQEITPLLDGYDIVKTTNQVNGYLFITGIKRIEQKQHAILTDTPLLQINVKPKKAGRLLFMIYPEYKKKLTRFLDNKVKIIDTQFKSFDVLIKE